MIALGTNYIISPIEVNILIYIYLSLFTIGYNINNRPMSSRIIQIIENTNELFIMLSGYALIYLSNWIYDVKYKATDLTIGDDPEYRYKFGFWYIGSLGIIVIINFVLIVYEIGKALYKEN